MSVHNVAIWKNTLDDVPAWTASVFLLDSLVNYAGAVDDDSGFTDREQTCNFLTAWRLAKPPGQLRRVSGPTPILDGRLSVAKLRKAFSKMTAAAAADLLVESYLSDPICGFSDSVAIIATALVAWHEAQSQHRSLAEAAALAPK